MTGSITLAGTPVNLHFNRGSIKSISSPAGEIISNMNGRTRFLSSQGDVNYRNESAFAFDDDTEYGLRTLQIPQDRKKPDYRVITDFIYGESSTEALVSVTVEYPEFKKDTIIYEAAVFETPLFKLTGPGISISVEDEGVSGSSTIKISPSDDISMLLAGKRFTFTSGGQNFPSGLS